jgi:hypothetical protein
MSRRQISDLVSTVLDFTAKILLTRAQAPGFSATPVIDLSAGNPIDMTLTGNITSMTFTGGVDGQKATLRLLQDGTGSRTLAFGSGVGFGSDITTITLSTAANSLDLIGIEYNAALSKYLVIAFSRGYS